jgi:ribose/xylose/arabinose/galactoside ABC-type transport system permease subunit
MARPTLDISTRNTTPLEEMERVATSTTMGTMVKAMETTPMVITMETMEIIMGTMEIKMEAMDIPMEGIANTTPNRWL